VTNYQQRFQDLGMQWPQISRPDLPFSPAVRVGELVFVSGQIPEAGADIAFTGKVGQEIDLETAKKAAALCTANIIHWLHQELDGDLDRVVRFAKVNVYVNAGPGFSDYSLVGNGASELLLKIFGARGQHARAALGMGGLPLNVPVEVDAVVQVR